VNPAKTAEPIEIPFWLWTQVDQRNHVLDGVQIHARKGAGNFEGKMPIHDMRGHARYTQSDSAGARIGTTRMQIGVYQMGCTLAQPCEYD